MTEQIFSPEIEASFDVAMRQPTMIRTPEGVSAIGMSEIVFSELLTRSGSDGRQLRSRRVERAAGALILMPEDAYADLLDATQQVSAPQSGADLFADFED